MGKKDRGAADSQLDKQKSSASQISSAVILVVDDGPLQRNNMNAVHRRVS